MTRIKKIIDWAKVSEKSRGVATKDILERALSNNMPDTVFGIGTFLCGVLKDNDDKITLRLFHHKGVRVGNQPACVELSKEEAKELAIKLLKYSTEDVPTMGLSLNCEYADWVVSVQQPKDLKGNPVNEPLLIIEGIEKEDIPDDGCCHMPIERDSAKELIEVLAKII